MHTRARGVGRGVLLAARMNLPRLVCGLAAVVLWSACLGAEPARETPMVWDVARLDAARDSHRAGGDLHATELAVTLREAENEFGRGPFTVTAKTVLAASGDPHDYHSVGPYWWPNPGTADGLPYVRRDGETNPGNEADFRALGMLNGAVRRLALSYHASGEERYAERAALFLRTWFLEAETRMNPNLRYAQALPGRNDGRAIGMIDTWALRELIEAERLLRASEAWTEADAAALRAWFAEFHDWFVNSDFGRQEAAEKNNHASWHLAQATAQAIFIGRDEVARARLEERLPALVAGQIAPDGSQPHEFGRTRSMHYGVFNLRALLECALMARHLGAEAGVPEGETGRRLRAAVAYLEAYADPASEWPYPELGAPRRDQLWILFRLAAAVFDEPALLRHEAVLPEPRETHFYHKLVLPGGE